MRRTHSQAVLLRAMRRGYGGQMGFVHYVIVAIAIGVAVDQITAALGNG